MDKDLLDSCTSGKLRVGKSQLLKHLRGERITRSQAIKAKCYDCDGMGDTGECEIEGCSLYPYSPFKKQS